MYQVLCIDSRLLPQSELLRNELLRNELLRNELLQTTVDNLRFGLLLFHHG
jgi:hypothetical protein